MSQKPAAKPTGGGLLQIPASATNKNSSQAAKNASGPARPSNANAPRLKLLVRRLPPGLTRAEFESAVGEEWAAGKGKVDYFLYKEGKVSKDQSKPSRPSRAYLRVTSAPLVQDLSDKVRTTTFIDARNTSFNSGPLDSPYVEYAPFARVPGGKVRKDARMGTIDQDPEFIAFLESLTNPAPKTVSLDDGNSEAEEKEKEEKEKEKENAAITPLIQFLRDKKASKAREKEAAAQARKEVKIAREKERIEKSQAKRVLSRTEKAGPVGAEKEKDKQKVDRATKDAVKAANKIANQPAGGKSVVLPAAPAAERRRERGNLTAATKILRRDLGLAPPSPRGRRGERAEERSPASPTTTAPPKTPSTPKGGRQENAGQRGTLKSTKKEPPIKAAAPNAKGGTSAKQHPSAPKKQQQSSPQSQAEPSQAASSTPSASGNTHAFLKHANPSQGVTEPLLHTGFSQFGTVTRVEIDRKKGFGYVDFAEPESLQKAIKASPVQIAQSKVVVLERKDGGKARKERVQPRGGQSQGQVQGQGQNQNQNQPASPSSQPVSGPMLSPAAQARAPPQGPRGGGRGQRSKGFGARGHWGRAAAPAGNAGQGATTSQGQGAGSAPTGSRGGR